MAVELDPEGYETNALFQFVDDIKGKDVLEVGCGDGRLTWRYAHIANTVTGIDPNASRIESAKKNTPANLREKIDLYPLPLEDFVNQVLTSPSAKRFELVLLSWSL